MNTYKVYGYITISWEREIEAESRDEAEDIALDTVDIETEWNGNSVFARDGETTLEVDGELRDIKVELIDGEEVDDLFECKQ